MATIDPANSAHIVKLLRTRKWAALGTLHDGAPSVSMVLYAPAPELSAFYLHLSRLSQHTLDIRADERVSLMITADEADYPNVQQMPRISIAGRALKVQTGDPDAARAQQLYLERFPSAQAMFTFTDFSLYRVSPVSARAVMGFAAAFTLRMEELLQIGNAGA